VFGCDDFLVGGEEAVVMVPFVKKGYLGSALAGGGEAGVGETRNENAAWGFWLSDRAWWLLEGLYGSVQKTLPGQFEKSSRSRE